MSGQPDSNVYQQLGQLQQSADFAERTLTKLDDEATAFRHEMRSQLAGLLKISEANARDIIDHGERLVKVEAATNDDKARNGQLIRFSAAFGGGAATVAGVLEAFKGLKWPWGS